MPIYIAANPLDGVAASDPFGRFRNNTSSQNAPPPAQSHVRRTRRDVRHGRQANTLGPKQVEFLIDYVTRTSAAPVADLTKVLLSFHAGLRACEISGLTIYDVTDAQGNIKDTITLRSGITKRGKRRVIPMSDELREVIALFRETYPDRERFAISKMRSLIREQSPNALAVYLRRLYIKAGFEGCSSHSGRRTLATNLARRHHEVGMSLRDVQLVLGHARLDTTEAYLEPAEDQKPLIDIASRVFSARRAITRLK